MSDNCNDGKPILLALGANLPSLWGNPNATFYRTLEAIESLHLQIIAVSKLYKTRAVGPGMQNFYYNAAIAVRGDMPASRLLREVKRIERKAGRKLGRVWGPRCLDIDILDYKGRVHRGGCHGREPGMLVLPHPHVHERAFALVPLLDVAPRWRHPVLRASAKDLLKAMPVRERTGIGPGLAFPDRACEKAA
jgi:2-amino-4-hydroxy-6-hydroxymethyldihydropteridine diphosphokinase